MFCVTKTKALQWNEFQWPILWSRSSCFQDNRQQIKRVCLERQFSLIMVTKTKKPSTETRVQYCDSGFDLQIVALLVLGHFNLSSTFLVILQAHRKEPEENRSIHRSVFLNVFICTHFSTVCYVLVMAWNNSQKYSGKTMLQATCFLTAVVIC